MTDRTSKPKQPPTAKSKQSPTTKPSQPPTAKPKQSPTTRPKQSPTTKPKQSPTTKPSQPPTAKPKQSPTTKPSQPPTAKPKQSPTTKLSQPPTAKPKQSPTTKPSHPTTAKPIELPTAKHVGGNQPVRLYDKYRKYIQSRVDAYRSSGRDYQKFRQLMLSRHVNKLIVVGGLDGGECVHSTMEWVRKLGFTPVNVDITLDTADWESELIVQAGIKTRGCLVIDHPLEYHTSLIDRISKLVQRTVVVVDDTFSPDVRGLSAAANRATVAMYDLPMRCTTEIVMHIVQQEGIVIPPGFMAQLSSDSGGNVACAVNRLQFESIVSSGPCSQTQHTWRNWNLFTLGKELLLVGHQEARIGLHHVEERALDRFLFANYGHTVDRCVLDPVQQLDALSQIADHHCTVDLLHAQWPPSSVTDRAAQHLMHNATSLVCRQQRYLQRPFVGTSLVDNLKQVNLCERNVRGTTSHIVYARGLNADREPILTQLTQETQALNLAARWTYIPLGDDDYASVLACVIPALYHTDPDFDEVDPSARKQMLIEIGVEKASLLALCFAQRFPRANLFAAPWWPVAWAALYYYVGRQTNVYRACIDILNEASDLMNTSSDLRQALRLRETTPAHIYDIVLSETR